MVSVVISFMPSIDDQFLCRGSKFFELPVISTVKCNDSVSPFFPVFFLLRKDQIAYFKLKQNCCGFEVSHVYFILA